jgi:hypothetical protein
MITVATIVRFICFANWNYFNLLKPSGNFTHHQV